ncbi:MAG: serine/threonine-protein kinase, partial [Candidatus Obscuribacterales bacterium]|nr:serine/threonine-protein kinase [Candidatus Obscuribacterales bacterium]
MSDPNIDQGIQDTDSSFEAALLSPGTLLSGRYKILEQIGRGAMGVVYKAEDIIVNRIVAVKTLRPDLVTEVSLKRFQIEAKTLATMNHPNIVPVYYFGSENGIPFIVMGFVEGKTLSEVQSSQNLDESQIRKIILQLADALEHAHGFAIVHRDIKPGNVIFDADEHVMLMDFGISKLLGDDSELAKLTQSGAIIGSPFYTAPEQCLGKGLDARSDIYSLSCLAYELVSGSPPFVGENSFDTFNLHATANAKPLTTCSQNLKNAISKGMEKKPESRFQSAKEFAEVLRSGEDLHVMPPRKNVQALVLLLSILVVVFAVLVIVVVDPLDLGLLQEPTERAKSLIRMGEKARIEKDYVNAKSDFERAIKILQLRNKNSELIHAYLGLSKVSFEQKEYGNARRIAQTAISKALALKDSNAEKTTLLSEAQLIAIRSYLASKNCDLKAVANLFSGLSRIQDNQSIDTALSDAEPLFMHAPADLKFRFLSIVATRSFAQSQFAKAEKYCKAAIETSNSLVERSNVSELMCRTLAAQGKLLEAEKYHRLAIDSLLNDQTYKKDWLAAQYLNFGVNQELQGKYKEAVLYLQKALVINREYASQVVYAENLSALASALELEGKTTEAMKILIGDPICDSLPASAGVCKLRQGQILRRLGRTAESERLLRESLALCVDKPEVGNHMAMAYLELGNLVSARGDHKYAFELFSKALPLLKSSQDVKIQVAYTEFWLCRESYELGKYQDSASFGRLGLAAISKGNLATSELAAGLFCLSKSLYSLGRYDEATGYIKQAVNILNKDGKQISAKEILAYARVRLE